MSRKNKTGGYGKRFLTVLLTLAMIVSLTPSLGALTGGALGAQEAYAADTISIQDGEYKISELIDNQGLKNGDILSVGPDTVLDVDVSFSLDSIEPKTMGENELTIKGSEMLTVENGINLGISGSFTMESGLLQINGPKTFGTFDVGIGCNNVTIHGGEIRMYPITLSTDRSNLEGIYATNFKMDGGTVTMDLAGYGGTGIISGIYCPYSNGSTKIENGTLDITVEDSYCKTRGIYSEYGDYVVTINGGTTNIKVKRTGDSNFSDAKGITAGSDGTSLDFYMKGGNLTLDVVNTGYNATALEGRYFDIKGGNLNIVAVTKKEGQDAYGIRTADNATVEIRGGTVETDARTYSTASGTAIGLQYNNSSATTYMNITGGTVTANGTSNGIQVYNGSDALPHENYIRGDAKVTAIGHTGSGINGVRDGGWAIDGTAEVNVKSTQHFGLYTEGVLSFLGESWTTIETESSGFAALHADAENAITISDTLEITTPAGGHTDEGRNRILDASNQRTGKVEIQPKDLTTAYVLFYDGVTGEKITDGSVIVYKTVGTNQGTNQEASSDPVVFKVGKGEDFTLTTGTRDSESGYDFTGWYKGVYPGTPFNKNPTITQNISSETWYYAEFTKRTELSSLTFTADKEPAAGKTKEECLPAVTAAEEGVFVDGCSWVDMSGSHLPEHYVFSEGEQVQLHISYSIGKAYKLAGDIKENTFVNGKVPATHDIETTDLCVVYTVPYNLESEKTEVTGITDKNYTGNVITQQLVVKYDGTELAKDTDYSVAYKNNINPGTATVTITGIGNYTGEITKTFQIIKKTGWVKEGGYWYFYNADGTMAKSTWKKDSKGWCYLGADGRMVTNGWAKDSKGWCWIGPDGYMVEKTQWIKVDGDWYHITNGYRDQSKWMKDSKGWCYLGADGRMVTNGWAKDSKGWCWMGADGYWVSNKWIQDNGEWYYIKSNHYMAANEWAKDSGGWMYMNASGKITRSKWVKDGGYWYYLKADGYMATGTQVIDGKTYRFDSSGRWIE